MKVEVSDLGLKKVGDHCSNVISLTPRSSTHWNVKPEMFPLRGCEKVDEASIVDLILFWAQM